MSLTLGEALQLTHPLEIAVWAAEFVRVRSLPPQLHRDDRGRSYILDTDRVNQGIASANKCVEDLRAARSHQ
jgi:hypothetical protein